MFKLMTIFLMQLWQRELSGGVAQDLDLYPEFIKFFLDDFSQVWECEQMLGKDSILQKVPEEEIALC